MNRQYMVLSLVAVILLSLMTGCDMNSDGVVRREGEPDYFETFDENLMDAAIAEAKSTLDTFVSELKDRSSGSEGFAIKKGFNYGKDNKEFIWVGEVSLDGSGFQGIINNEPVNQIGVELGQRVKVDRDEVADWMFMSNGRLQGGYTIVALIYGTEEQSQYEASMGIDWSMYKFLENKE